jgi:hypothetical protein
VVGAADVAVVDPAGAAAGGSAVADGRHPVSTSTAAAAGRKKSVRDVR